MLKIKKITIIISLLFIGLLGAGNAPENLKVLKFESNREVIKLMKSISKDLGVKCKFCHDMRDKAKDTPHKEISRKFMLLVEQVNSDIMNWDKAPQITCWTCHRGKTHPETTRPKEE